MLFARRENRDCERGKEIGRGARARAPIVGGMVDNIMYKNFYTQRIFSDITLSYPLCCSVAA